MVGWIKLVLIENGWMVIGEICGQKSGFRGFGEEKSGSPIINGQVYLTSCMISGFGHIDEVRYSKWIGGLVLLWIEVFVGSWRSSWKDFWVLMDLSETPMHVFSFLFSPSCQVGQSCLES